MLSGAATSRRAEGKAAESITRQAADMHASWPVPGCANARTGTRHPLWTTLLCALLPLGASLRVVRVEAERLQASPSSGSGPAAVVHVHVHGTMALMLPNNGERKRMLC